LLYCYLLVVIAVHLLDALLPICPDLCKIQEGPPSARDIYTAVAQFEAASRKQSKHSSDEIHSDLTASTAYEHEW